MHPLDPGRLAAAPSRFVNQCRVRAAAVLTPGTVQYQGGNTYYMQVGSVLPNVGDYFTVRA